MEAILIGGLILWFLLVLAYSILEWICFRPNGLYGLLTDYFFNIGWFIVLGIRGLGWIIYAVIVLALALVLVAFAIFPVITIVIFLVF